MGNPGGLLGTSLLHDARRALALQGSLLWTPAAAARNGDSSGLIVVARLRPLAVVIGGRIVETGGAAPEPAGSVTGGGLHQVSTAGGGQVITGGSRQEPSRIIGHPDLASGASVQRGDALYVSVAEAIYRESRGEDVEIHLVPTEEDAQALADLRIRARQRWENDRLPDGWTRPLPPPQPIAVTPSPKEKAVTGGLTDELRALADRIRAKEADRDA